MIGRTTPETKTVGGLGLFAPSRLIAFSLPSAIAASLYATNVPIGAVPNLPPSRLVVSAPKASPQINRQGSQVSINGRTLPAAWSQWQRGKSVRTGISDAGVAQTLGVELLNTGDLTKQPIQWFSGANRLILATFPVAPYRYLDITDFALKNGWQTQIKGNTLLITTKPARLADVQQSLQPWGSRLVVDLDRPTPWQVTQQGQNLVVTINAAAPPAILQRFPPPPPEPKPEKEVEGIRNPQPPAPNPQPLIPNPQPPIPNPQSPIPNPQPPIPVVESTQNQTTIRVQIPAGLYPRVFSLPSPNRLLIDFQPEAMVERDILWAEGIRWKQQYVAITHQSSANDSPLLDGGSVNPKSIDRFPVASLTINLRQKGLTLKPIWSNPNSVAGIAPLLRTAQLWQASAAINAGFFNRNNQLPLGAIKQDGRWLSGPILNRGAIALNDAGEVKMGRLSYQGVLDIENSSSLPVLFFNSAYVKAGIALYSSEWGGAYTPLTDNEIIVVVQNNQVTNQLPGGIAGKISFPIPPQNGYLLTIRGKETSPAGILSVGTRVRMNELFSQPDFVRYPQIVGAGPLLVQNRQIVLDAKAEQFSDAFIKEAAARSAIATTASGQLMMVAIHNRTGGKGPTLAETAQIMQQMGAVEALNLDGGSSTSLYLGGQLINRPPTTAARVHNGLGLFRPPGLRSPSN
ncbi:phosphodiester glycosidase family protein [Cyanobacteria bacterium FACHB-472]|nr:phosphodiester glycosidase family protein [Cyanobacteria bacterium FACHB-472]